MPIRNGPQRRSMRLSGWDYRSPGPYGMTLVTQHREGFFGEVVKGRMILNAAGAMVAATWQQMESQFPRIALDIWVVMPNHLHAIIWLSNDGPAGNPSLGEVIHRFKTWTTIAYSDGVHEHGWAPYDRRLWQRDYFDQIIRTREQLLHARRYIALNPANWNDDPDRDPLPPTTTGI